MINPETGALHSDRSDYYEYTGELVGNKTNRKPRQLQPFQSTNPNVLNSTRKGNKNNKQQQQPSSNRQYQSEDEGDHLYISDDGRLAKSRMVIAPLKNPNSIHDYLYLLAKKNDSGTHYFSLSLFFYVFLFLKIKLNHGLEWRIYNKKNAKKKPYPK
jgi:hypothetical protein